jgi:hypothetical protein
VGWGRVGSGGVGWGVIITAVVARLINNAMKESNSTCHAWSEAKLSSGITELAQTRCNPTVHPSRTLCLCNFGARFFLSLPTPGSLFGTAGIPAPVVVRGPVVGMGRGG